MLRIEMKFVFSLLLAAIAGGACANSARADVCYGSDPFSNQIYRVNLDTGALSNSVPVSLAGETVTGITALTAHPTTGVVYGVVKVASTSTTRRLVTLDPTTGAATLVGAVPRLSSISFNSAGVLYAMTGQGGTPASTLYTVSTVDGTATIVYGPVISGPDGEVIAFGPGDTLYHSSGNGTATFSIINLPANTTTPLGTAAGEMFGMGYRASNATMYCSDINSQLFTVNLSNGARTPVGTMQFPDNSAFDTRGLAIIGDPPGACCSAAGICTSTTAPVCAGAGGFFQANGVCTPSPCPIPGACCHGATCSLTIAPLCTGGFVGAGSACAPQVLGGTVNACCRADFNGSGAVSVQDIFDFLSAYFAGCP